MERIGFIGIGLMGQHIARHLLEAGHSLTVWNRTEKKAEDLLSAGAAWAGSPKEVAQVSDVLITMVTDSAASEEVTCGPGGILEQEDSEVWMQQFKGSNIDFADDRPYFYGLGLGEEKPHPELPGLVSVTANEFYARHFFSRWRDDLRAVEGRP